MFYQKYYKQLYNLHFGMQLALLNFWNQVFLLVLQLPQEFKHGFSNVDFKMSMTCNDFVNIINEP